MELQISLRLENGKVIQDSHSCFVKPHPAGFTYEIPDSFTGTITLTHGENELLSFESEYHEGVATKVTLEDGFVTTKDGTLIFENEAFNGPVSLAVNGTCFFERHPEFEPRCQRTVGPLPWDDDFADGSEDS